MRAFNWSLSAVRQDCLVNRTVRQHGPRLLLWGDVGGMRTMKLICDHLIILQRY